MLEQLQTRFVKKLVKMREDTEFDTFWERATTTAEELQLSDPMEQRVRGPRRVNWF